MPLTFRLQVVLACLLACAFLNLAEASVDNPPFQFKCANGKSVLLRYLCDRDNDCGDNSDEEVCDPFDCHPSAFQCLNGKCISPNWICNGYDNCGDNSDDQFCEPFQCHPLAFQCLNGKCKSRHFFCYGEDHCGDNSDERYCNKSTNEVCPHAWFQCTDKKRCIPSQWVCDGYPDCSDESEEINCNASEFKASTNLKSWVLKTRKSSPRTDRWGSQVHRIAVALHLADNSTFGLGHSAGEELRYELTIKLLYRLVKDKTLSSHELALYTHALLVSCLDPRDFFGYDLVRELRRRVEATGSYTDPFLILVLCSTGDAMTARDLDRVTAAFNSQNRPFSVDSQALASMALSCISSRSGVSVDERILKDMLRKLKRHQLRDNIKTTALVTQALFIHDSYKKDFNLDSAMRILIDGSSRSQCLLDAYYALPVLSWKSLLNVSATHCGKQPVAEEEPSQEMLDVNGKFITVQYSVWMGDDINQVRTWRLRMRVNNSIYNAIETVAKIGDVQMIEYNVVDGKPFVTALNGKENNPEIGMFWFIYLKTLNSDEDPELVEESPVDIKLKPNQEIILWYKSGLCSDRWLMKKPVTST